MISNCILVHETIKVISEIAATREQYQVCYMSEQQRHDFPFPLPVNEGSSVPSPDT